MNHFNLIDKGHSYAGCHSSHVGLKERNSPGQVNPSQWEMSFLPPPRYGCWKKTTTQTSTVWGRGTRIYGFLSQLESLPWLKSVLSSPIILYLSGVATNQNREYKPISEASETAQKQTFSQHWKQPSEHGRLYKSSTLCFWIDYW